MATVFVGTPFCPLEAVPHFPHRRGVHARQPWHSEQCVCFDAWWLNYAFLNSDVCLEGGRFIVNLNLTSLHLSSVASNFYGVMSSTAYAPPPPPSAAGGAPPPPPPSAAGMTTWQSESAAAGPPPAARMPAAAAAAPSRVHMPTSAAPPPPVARPAAAGMPTANNSRGSTSSLLGSIRQGGKSLKSGAFMGVA